MEPGLTMGIDWERGCISGEIDGRKAVGQAVQLALATSRWRYPIFSGEYGSEVESLVGAHRDLIKGELERLVSEALSRDERILGIKNLSLAFTRDQAEATFTVRTQFGEIEGVERVDL